MSFHLQRGVQRIVVNKKTGHAVQSRRVSERSDEFLRLLENGFLSDICLEVGTTGKVFQAHQIILSVSSEFFRNFFFNVVTGPETVLKIRDADAEDFQEILRFIYTEQLKPRSALSCIATCRLAKRFQIPSYISVCESYILKNVTVSNVIHVYEFALREHLAAVTENAREAFCTHAAAIFKTPEFLSCSAQLLEMIVQDVHNAMDLSILVEGLTSWSADWTQHLRTLPRMLVRTTQICCCDWYKNERGIAQHALALPIKSKQIAECKNSELVLCCRFKSVRTITVKGVAANVYKQLPFASSRYRAKVSFQTGKREKRCNAEVERVNGLLKFTFSSPFVVTVKDLCHITISLCSDDDIYVYEEGKYEIHTPVSYYYALQCRVPLFKSYGLIKLVILEGD